ncbi:MAG: hypothetical protein RL189_2626 [Pseudomonadota bacterium]|jgi:uncharacterized protein (DUF2141 family)
MLKFSFVSAVLSATLLLSGCQGNEPSALQSLNYESVQYISIVVKNLRGAQTPDKRTQICYAVFAGPQGFPSDPSAVVLNGCKNVTSSIESFLIENLPPSQDGYVVSLFEDMNLNGKLDTRSIFGIQVPDEPFGFTQNPPLTGAPTYDKCKINPTRNGEKFEITMKKIGGG